MDKEKIPSANNEPQKSDWEILMERGAKSEDSAAKTETETSQELVEKRSVREFLSEKDQNLYDKTLDKLKKLSDSKALFTGERFFVEDADKKAAEILFPDISESDSEAAAKHTSKILDIINGDLPDLNGSACVSAIDYVTIRDRAEKRLANYIEQNGESFDEIMSDGAQEYMRILRPRPGDDITRMWFSASILADGNPKGGETTMIFWDNSEKDRSEEYEKSQPLLEARMRDFGNYRRLREELAQQLGRPELADYDVATMLTADTDNDGVLEYLRCINPIRIDRDHGRIGDIDRNSKVVDFDKIEGLDPKNIGIILPHFDKSPLYAWTMAKNLSPEEIIGFSEQEANNYAGFIDYVNESFDGLDEVPEDVRRELSYTANAIMYCGIKNGDELVKGAYVRSGDGALAKSLYDKLLTVAKNDSDPLRLKKIKAVQYMLSGNSGRMDQAEGYSNLFAAMDAGDEIAMGLVEDETFPDGTPNPDANKNWTRGFGLGVANYEVACYISEVTPSNIQRLVLEHDSLPGLSKAAYFQNREDSRVLSGDEKNSDELRIFESRDFIHNEMPHAHEVLVYTWAYQKIGRGESISEEEHSMLRQAGVSIPIEGASDEERSAALDTIRQKYLDFLAQNEELSNIVLGDPYFGLSTEDKKAYPDLSDSEKAIKKREGRNALLDRLPFNLAKYDESMKALDTSTGITREEKVSDILWRLVKNTNRRKIESPKTNDATLDEMLAKIDLTISPNGSAPIDLRELRNIMPYVNEKLVGMQGSHELTPQLVDGISFVSRAANYAVKDLPKRELRELLFDPTFKEIIRFHSLTSSSEKYSNSSFEQLWAKLTSRLDADANDGDYSERFTKLNKSILDQVEPLVREYRGLSEQQNAIADDLMAQTEAPRFPKNYLTGFAGRTVVALNQDAEVHNRQALVERNFANSVWSLNLSSTLAKIGQELI